MTLAGTNLQDAGPRIFFVSKEIYDVLQWTQDFARLPDPTCQQISESMELNTLFPRIFMVPVLLELHSCQATFQCLFRELPGIWEGAAPVGTCDQLKSFSKSFVHILYDHQLVLFVGFGYFGYVHVRMWKTLPKYIEYTPILVSTKYNQLIDKGWTIEQLKIQQKNEQVRTRAIQIVVEWSVAVIICKTALQHWCSDDDPPVALWGFGANLTRGPPPVRTTHKTHVNIHPQQLHFIHGCIKIGLKILWTYNFQGCCRGY